MNEQVAENYLDDVRESFRSYKELADKSFEQISDAEFFYQLDAESNSIAVIVKHLASNLRSRWTDFLTSDGEKPDRDRDAEFVALEEQTRELLMQQWENGWNALFAALKLLQISDLDKIIRIRGESYTVLAAINRALTHAAYHVGQIVFLAKHLRSSEWQSLSIPRNRSTDFKIFAETAARSDSSSQTHWSETVKQFNNKQQT